MPTRVVFSRECRVCGREFRLALPTNAYAHSPERWNNARTEGKRVWVRCEECSRVGPANFESFLRT